MHPAIWIYGGVHHDPGTRQQFLRALAQHPTPPHFVAVEWEQSVFDRFVAWRPWIAERLEAQWDFLTHEDCHELSLALAWEADAYIERFRGVEPQWLESGFQEGDLQQLNCQEECQARCLFNRLTCPPTVSEQLAGIAPPELRSKHEIIDRVWKETWFHAWGETEGSERFERDARWAAAITTRSRGLHDGWIAVVVGRQHADPEGHPQRLHGLLSSAGYHVIPVKLAP